MTTKQDKTRHTPMTFKLRPNADEIHTTLEGYIGKYQRIGVLLPNHAAQILFNKLIEHTALVEALKGVIGIIDENVPHLKLTDEVKEADAALKAVEGE